jgi:hypothetical protein
VFSIADGLKEGSIGADGNLHGVLQLGLAAQSVSVSVPIPSQTLASVALSDLVLPGVIKIGPQIALGAGGSLTIGASGQLIAGATLDWPAIHAKLDVTVANKAQQSGFSPNVTPVFSAKGSVSASFEAYLRASLGFTIGILNIDKFTKTVELVDQPGVTATASVSGSAQLANGQVQGQIGGGGCNGVSVPANVYNKVYASLAGLSQVDIFDWSSPALTGCLSIGPKRSLRRPQAYLSSADRRQYNTVVRQPLDAHPHTAPVAEKKTVEGTAKLPFSKRQSFSSASNGTLTNSTITPLNTTSSTPVVNDDESGVSENGTYSLISSQDDQFDIHWSDNGNLYAIASNDTTDAATDDPDPTDSDSDYDSRDITTQFSTANSSFLLGDANGRALHGYSDEIAQYVLPSR